MNKAIGILEFKTVASGISAADAMLKAAEVDIAEAMAVCPGKYITIIAGGLAAVNAAAQAAKAMPGEGLIGSFVLGNPHEGLLRAVYGATERAELRALGVIETYDCASALAAADAAVKTAVVDLIEIRLAKGMCGKSYILLTGDVAAVRAATDKATEIAGEAGMYLDSCVIPNPHENLERYLC